MIQRVFPSYIEIKGSRTPYSPRFRDVYFMEDLGIEESLYHYIDGNQFLTRFDNQDHLTIAELGFGVGLNFLLTWKKFQELKSNQIKTLRYFSFEKFPVVQSELKRLYELYPELKNQSQALLENYPVLTPGIHRLNLGDPMLDFRLILGDANHQIQKTHFTADIWYLDGFNPSENPDLFDESLFKEVSKRSKVGSTASSFTSAGWVRRGLESAGFQVKKVKGFNQKRESLRAECINPIQTNHTLDQKLIPTHPVLYSKRKEKIAILGAGLAGAAIAFELNQRGHEVEIFDPAGIAQAASGNPIGLFNAQLSLQENPISRFSQAALADLIRYFKTQKYQSIQYGIHRYESDAETCLRALGYPEDFFTKTQHSLFLPKCGMIHTHQWVMHQLQGFKFHQCAIRSVQNFDTHLELLDEHDQKHHFSHVIYTMGAHPKFIPLINPEHTPIRAIRGQIVRFEAPLLDSDSTHVQSGYLCSPAKKISGDSLWTVGATYQTQPVDEDTQKSLDSQFLLEEAKRIFKNSELGKKSELHPGLVKSTRSAFRASTPDKLPLIGPKISMQELNQTYGKYFRGKIEGISDLPPYQPSSREWVLTSLGSRGITTAHLCAVILAELMHGEPLSIESDLISHLHTTRFARRFLSRQTGNDRLK